jgi:putative membrane protein
MSNQNVSGNSDQFIVRPTADSHFSWLRTRLSVDRTLMAWVRTAVSLIGFGFAIVQFFDRLEQMPGTNPARYPDAARYLGLALIFCGVMALTISLWEYRWIIRYLRSGSFAAIAGEKRGRTQAPVIATSILLAAIAHSPFFPCWRVSCNGGARGENTNFKVEMKLQS